MAYYKDLRDYLKALEAQGLLRKVSRPVNKDTELHPLVRLQFRGLPEEQRTAWLFENVTDVKGKKYSMPVVAAAIAGSRFIYAARHAMQAGRDFREMVPGSIASD